MLIPSDLIEDEELRQEIEQKRVESLFRHAIAAGRIEAIIAVELTDYKQRELASVHFSSLYQHYLSQIPTDAYNHEYPNGTRVYRVYIGGMHEYICSNGKWRLHKVTT